MQRDRLNEKTERKLGCNSRTKNPPGPGSIRWWDDQYNKTYIQMDIKFKRLTEDAIAPVKAHDTDAGFDLTCTNITTEINECG